MRDPLSFMVAMTRQHGDVVAADFGDFRAFIVNHPDWIEHVLVKNHRNYSKQTVQFTTFSEVTGNGLLNSDGDFWRRQRRIVQPAFHRKTLTDLATIMTDAADRTAARWRTQPGAIVDIEHEMLLLSLPVICESLFGADIRARAAELVEAVTHALDRVMFRAQLPIAGAERLPLAVNRRFEQSMKVLEKWIAEMIDGRRAESVARTDLLGILLSATDEDGRPLPDVVIRDEVMTLIVAGYETVASGLTWIWYLLDQHPYSAQWLREELSDVLHGRTPTLADLPHLPRLKMIVDESFRLYPPSWLVSRQAVAADRIAGHAIEPGALVIISPWVMHRNAAFWPDPEQFDPLRFDLAKTDKPKTRPRYSYIPFGGGPRLCIGNHFALLETQLVLATLAQQFAPTLAQKRPHVAAMVTVRPKNGLQMQIN